MTNKVVTNVEVMIDEFQGAFNILETEGYQCMVSLNNLKTVLETATSGQEVFDAYKGFIESIIIMDTTFKQLDVKVKDAGTNIIDPLLKLLDGK